MPSSSVSHVAPVGFITITHRPITMLPLFQIFNRFHYGTTLPTLISRINDMNDKKSVLSV